jgi:integrase
MASIRKRNNKWQARIFRTGHSPEAKTFINRTDAIKWARRTEILLEQRAVSPRGDKTDLASLIERYLNEVTPKKKNWRNETYILKSWAKESISQKEIYSVNAAELTKIRDRMISQGKSSGTVRNYLAALSAVFQQALLDWGYEGLENPVRRIRRPAPSRNRSRRVSDQEIQAICKATGSPFLPTITKLAVETAMRQSELAGLLWENINLRHRTALLQDTKNGEARTVPLSSAAVELLTQWQKRENSFAIKGPVFGFTPHAVAVAFRRAVRRARNSGVELADIRFHDLRHEAVSRLFERGLNTMEVAAISGHRTLQMLARYTHLRAEDLALKLR